MRVLPELLVASALASGLVHAGPCGYGLTCGNPPTDKSCSPEAAAEFALVAPLLEQCDALTNYFNRGVWDRTDTTQLCDLSSPCGKIVPWTVSTLADIRVCSPYEKYYYVLYTFRGFCRSEPVANLPGDNGLLASLKAAQPAPTTTAPRAPPPTTTAPSPPVTTVTTVTPPPTTAAPPSSTPAPSTTAPTPGPMTTSSEANETTMLAPSLDGSSSASAASEEGEIEPVVEAPAATSNQAPTSLPSSTKAASSAATSAVSVMATVAVAAATTAALAWL